MFCRPCFKDYAIGIYFASSQCFVLIFCADIFTELLLLADYLLLVPVMAQQGYGLSSPANGRALSCRCRNRPSGEHHHKHNAITCVVQAWGKILMYCI